MATKKDIISIASKLLGLYLFIQTLGLVQYLLNTLLFGSEYTGDFWDRFIPFLYLLTSIVIYVMVGILLIERSSTVADYLVRKEENTSINLPINKIIVLETTFILIGSITVINILPNLFTNIVTWLKLEIKNEYEYGNFNMTDDNLIFSIIKVTIAIVIVVNARSLANWIERRSASKIKEEPIEL